MMNDGGIFCKTILTYLFKRKTWSFVPNMCLIEFLAKMDMCWEDA